MTKKTFAQAMRESGASSIGVFFASLRIFLRLTKKRRRALMEHFLMTRKEQLEVREAILATARRIMLEQGESCDRFSKSQVEDLLHSGCGNLPTERAFKELVKEGYTKVIPAKMRDKVYKLTGKKYISKKAVLVELLKELGVYSRALQEHKPYYIPPEYRLK